MNMITAWMRPMSQSQKMTVVKKYEEVIKTWRKKMKSLVAKQRRM